jgi:hypothetical protein
MSAGRPVAAGTALGVTEFVHLTEHRVLDALHHQLGDPVPPAQLDRLPQIVFTTLSPTRAASPERGCTNAA